MLLTERGIWTRLTIRSGAENVVVPDSQLSETVVRNRNESYSHDVDIAQLRCVLRNIRQGLTAVPEPRLLGYRRRYNLVWAQFAAE